MRFAIVLPMKDLVLGDSLGGEGDRYRAGATYSGLSSNVTTTARDPQHECAGLSGTVLDAELVEFPINGMVLAIGEAGGVLVELSFELLPPKLSQEAERDTRVEVEDLEVEEQVGHMV